MSLGGAVFGAPPALASSTGGVVAGANVQAPPAAAPKRTKPKVPPGAAPVTARRSAGFAYAGPVFERTAAGTVVPYVPLAAAAQASLTGGSAVSTAVPLKPQLLVPGTRAQYVGGLAAAPISAPPAVQQVIWAANQIIGLPYVYGGGHASFTAAGYDCSGTVSYALHGAALLKMPEDSSEFEGFGSSGVGRWVTIFSNPGHAYMTVAGIRLDTSAADDPSNQQGPRWRPLRPGNEGFVVRHPLGL